MSLTGSGTQSDVAEVVEHQAGPPAPLAQRHSECARQGGGEPAEAYAPVERDEFDSGHGEESGVVAWVEEHCDVDKQQAGHRADKRLGYGVLDRQVPGSGKEL